MSLSPAVRHVLTIIATLVAAGGALLASGEIGDVPEWVGVTITVLGTLFAALGIVPGQVGGTQQGVVNPSVTEPPKVNEAGYAEGGLVVFVLVLLVVVIFLKAVTGSWLVFLLLLLVVLAFLF